MSEHAVSDDRWKCGRSSNKACGINRNEGWFFIDGCFSRCRREEDCLGSLSIHEVVRGFFLAVYHTGDTWWFILQRVEKAQSNIILPCTPFSHIKFIIKRKKITRRKFWLSKNLFTPIFCTKNKSRMRKQSSQFKLLFYILSFIWSNFWNTLIIVSKSYRTLVKNIQQ